MRSIGVAMLSLVACVLAAGCAVAPVGGDGSSTLVGPQGGQLSGNDGSRLDVPAGAMQQYVRLGMTPAGSAPAMTTMSAVGPTVVLSPSGARFGIPVTLSLPHDAPPSGGVVRIATYDSAAERWVEVPGSIAAGAIVTAEITHFSLYAAVVRSEGEAGGGRIVGHVRDPEGHAISGATVEVIDGPASVGVTVTTGEAGGYELEGLAAGTYALRAGKTGYQSAEKGEIAVVSGEATEVNFTLEGEENPEEPGLFYGHVRDAAGEPIVEARVEVVSGPSGGGSFALTGEAGGYEIADLAPGTYSLCASRPGHTAVTKGELVLEAGQHKEVNFILSTEGGGGDETGVVFGCVKNAEGQPLAEATVDVVSGPSREGEHVYTNEEGTYEIGHLVPGTYALRASKPGYESRTEDGVQVVAGHETEVDFILLAGGEEPGAIRGHVRDGDGNPIVEAKVEVLSGPSREGDFVFTDAEGAYEIADLTPGHYGLKASREGYASQTKDAIEVTSGNDTEVNFTLVEDGGGGETGVIFGHVRNAEEEPINEAKVLILDGPSHEGDWVYTNAEGGYEWTGLVPGTYAVKASKTGYESSTEDGVVVTAGDETELDFTLHSI